MMSHVHWFCITLTWVVMYSIDVQKDMTVFRKCAQEEQCDFPLAEFEPYGSLLCFDKCLQLSSCSHVRFDSKMLVCRICSASKNVQSDKPNNSQSEGDWSCRKKPNLALSSECQPGSRCVKSRSGETKCVPYDLQEHSQRRARMSTQPRENTKLFNMTERDLTDNWTTTKIQGPDMIMTSLTWSPSFANEFYILSERKGVNFVIELFILRGNLLEKHVQWDNVLLPRKYNTMLRVTIDTGPCLKNDSMSCIYVFGWQTFLSSAEVHLCYYREVKSPRHLELEREGVITQHSRGALSVFACRGKFGIFVYSWSVFQAAVKRSLIHAGKGAFTLNESGNINGLSGITRMKWNYDGSFALAVSIYDIFLIRHLDDKEEVVIKVKYEWLGHVALVWTNTSILFFKLDWAGKALSMRCFKF